MLSSIKVAAALVGLACYTYAIPETTTPTTAAPTSSGTPGITLSVTTAVASATVPLTSVLPSQSSLPPIQPWCIGEIFCPGSLLQTVNFAQVFSDMKAIVDKPTNKPPQQVLADFAAFNTSDVTEGDILTFMDNDFRGEGLELQGASLPEFTENPAFLSNIADPMVRAFAQIVNGYWPNLARTVNQSAVCDIYPGGACQGTFLPLNHSFIIPGGRFREQYYWDSYWIVQGLLQSQLYDTINSTLQNFMDEIQDFGFIPNGGRTYYLDRSQPPLFTHMLFDYVNATGDTSILERGLCSAEAELSWWSTNRTTQVTSPYTDQNYSMFRYAVNNSAPRPESYLDDYQTVHDPTLPTLTDDQAALLYSNIASGAETGWDYSSRFESDPQLGSAGLRTLNVRNTVPVDLNSILYKAHTLLANMYQSSNPTVAASHLQVAAELRAGILDLMWDPTKLAFYDFNLTSNARNSIFTAATFYPVWNDIIPNEVLASQANAFGYFASVNMVLNKYNGTFPVTFVDWTGQQWDAPNAWPPHQYIVIRALEALPTNLTTNTLPTPPAGNSVYDLVPAGQLNFTEAQLPGQPYHQSSANVTATGSGSDVNRLNGTVVNGGNATAGEGWANTLKREMANRYVTSVLCSWHATGGSIPGILPQLPNSVLNLTNSINNTGNMFEKFSNLNVDSSGFGGEYTVQVGFGWTNGVLLWVTGTYGHVLTAPQCPSLLASVTGSDKSGAAAGLRLPMTFVGTVIVAVLVPVVGLWFY